MNRGQIEQVLTDAESALAPGGRVDLGQLGFWKAVSAVKKDSQLIEQFADRIGAIDREAFRRSVWLRVPNSLGALVAIVVTVGGLVIIGWAYRLGGPAQGVALLVGSGLVLAASHTLAHWLVARAQGMRVLTWFVAGLRRPQPGIKIDYATYLRVPARNRAWMHAAGAIVSKVVPLVSLGAGLAMEAPVWALIALGALVVVQIIADLIWSTKSSDWKKFRREMRLADSQTAAN